MNKHIIDKEIKAFAIKTLHTKKDKSKILFEEGEVLNITYHISGTVYIYRPNGFKSSYSEHKDNGNWSYEEIKGYFITFAEWRQQQIDKILNEL